MSVWKLSPNECRTLDLSNPDELLRYAKKLIGHSFREVLMLGISPDDSSMKDYGNVKFKGGMGTLIEERYFGYKANSDEHPDFPDAGVELKATCYDVKKDGELSNMSRTLSRGNEGPSQENLSRLGPFYHHPMISSDRLCHQTDARIRSLIFAG